MIRTYINTTQHTEIKELSNVSCVKLITSFTKHKIMAIELPLNQNN